MFTRLQQMGLAEYECYKGASLTGAGRREALGLLRRHRLIETFLLECLGYSWEEVHKEAESLEHSVTDRFTERLAEFLGHPTQDPHGDPIPGVDGSMEVDESFALCGARVGERVRIYRVAEREGAELTTLRSRVWYRGRKCR